MFEIVLHYSYLLPIICFLFLGKKQMKINTLLIVAYSIVFFLLLIFIDELNSWINQHTGFKGFYLSFYTFLEYIFFTSFIYINISSKTLKKAFIYLSVGFVIFQVIYYLNFTIKNLDSVPIGVETILLFGYVIFFFYEQFRKPSNISIYNHYCFWICVGILIYLGGSFFFYIMAGQMPKTEIKEHWYLTYIGEIIKNIFFSFSILLFARQKNGNGIHNKILPNLDMV